MTQISFLCDTNIISELARPQPNSGVLSWVGQVSSIAISVITVEEVFYGLSAKPNPKIQTWFEAFWQQNCIILPINPDIARLSGEIRGKLRARGKTHTQADLLIAATARIHQLTLVTRNVRDFDQCSISLLNPFT